LIHSLYKNSVFFCAILWLPFFTLQNHFFGFDWYKETEDFLLAKPEKALADCLYLFTRKKKQYGFFPELNLKKPFSIKKVEAYICRIPDKNVRTLAQSRLKEILENQKTGVNKRGIKNRVSSIVGK
ncbi:MAG: hypothetical protein COS68_07535, partial [Elusimicrobia bacterium CG06_land_8_20_14_3_00_38_11]